MKKIYLFLILLALGFSTNAQTVPSSCTGPDSLRAKYDFDATKMAIRNLYISQHPDTAEIRVADIHKEAIFEALIAIYQVEENLPARDEVVDFFNVHALGGPLTNSFVLYADTSYQWVENWMLGIDELTGNPAIDMWVDSFDLAFNTTPFFDYNETLGGDYLKIHFQTIEHLNIQPLLAVFESVEGVSLAVKDNFILEIEKDIEFKDFSATGYIELVYRYGWDNCEVDCLNEHIWTFRVYQDDCSVAFSGDSGDPLPVEEVNQISRLAIFPNPTSDKVNLNLVGPQGRDISVYLFDAFGQMILQNEVDSHNGLINLDFSLRALPVGVYFITLEHENQVLTERVMKN